MPAPVIRQFVGTIPDKGQSQTAFDTNVDAFLDWQALQFAPDLVAFGVFASDTAAALVAANLPSLTGRALNAVRVNAAADGVEFRTPAQVLADIGAATTASVALKAPLASPALTGTPTAPTAAAATNTTQLATTAMVQAAIAASPSVGVGQTWQDMAASRTHSTTYQNTSGEPIEVLVSINGSSGRYFQVSVNNSTWITLNDMPADRFAMSFIVPNTHYYRMQGGSTTIVRWSELRA
jgi:hypothetical protein